MSAGGAWRFRVARLLGRSVTRTAATLTFFRMPPFVSASAIVADGERILVVIDPIRNEAVLPGGHLRWRESPEEAVVREVREETGYLIQPDELLAVVSGEQWADEPGIVRVVFTATLLGGELRSSAEGDAMWQPVSALVGAGGRDAPLLRRWLSRPIPHSERPERAAQTP